MRESFENRLFSLGKKLAEGGVTAQFSADNQRVQEKANNFFKLAAIAAADGGTYQQVVLAGQTGHQYIESCQRHHDAQRTEVTSESSTDWQQNLVACSHNFHKHILLQQVLI